MKNRRFRLIAIVFLLCAVILQGFSMNATYAAVKEIGLASRSGSGNYGFGSKAYSKFTLRNMAERDLVTGVKVNDIDYKETNEKTNQSKAVDELSAGKKYHFYDRGFGQPDIYVSKVKVGDVVKLVTNEGWLEIKITKSGYGTIHDERGSNAPKFVKGTATPKPNPNPNQPEQKTKFTLKVVKNNMQNKFYFEISPKLQATDITNVMINNVNYKKATSKHVLWNGEYNGIGYYVEDSNLHVLEPRQNENILTFTHKDGTKHSFVYKRTNRNGDVLEESDNVPAPKKLKLRLEGSFEPAMEGQKKYDGISSASLAGANSNRNSNVVLKATFEENPKDTDWKLFHEMNHAIAGVPRLLFDGISENSPSGMKGQYFQSKFTLNGTPAKEGNDDVKHYKVEAEITESDGKKIKTENNLTFSVYSYNCKLIDYLKTDNCRKTEHDGKFIWDMKPWAISKFGGTNETVTVPKDIKAWYGSNESGKYGYLGYYPGKGEQTLIVDKDTNLTLVNMQILSSVRIVVKDGGVLNIMDSSIHGKIEVEKGGTLQVNYNAKDGKFSKGSSINGQIELKEGAVLENSLIYSNTNYLPDGDKARHNVEPVVKVTGNATIKGNVFIRGDEAPTGDDPATGKPYTGQPALGIENAALTIDKDAVLGTYGGGRMVLTSIGAPAIKLKDGKIEGEGKLVALAGRTEYKDAKEAVEGKGTLAVAKMYLQGGDTYDSHGKGGAPKSDDVEVKETAKNTKPIGKLLDGKVLPKPQMDDHQEWYWKNILEAPPVPDFGDKEIDLNNKKPGNPNDPKDPQVPQDPKDPQVPQDPKDPNDPGQGGGGNNPKPNDPSNPGQGGGTNPNPQNPGQGGGTKPNPQDPGQGGGNKPNPQDPSKPGNGNNPKDPSDPGQGGGTKPNPQDPGQGGGTNPTPNDPNKPGNGNNPKDPSDPGQGGGNKPNPQDPGQGGGNKPNPQDPSKPGNGNNPSNPGQGNGNLPNNPSTDNSGTVLPVVPLPEDTQQTQPATESNNSSEKPAADTTEITEIATPEGEVINEIADDVTPKGEANVNDDTDDDDDDMDTDSGKTVKAKRPGKVVKSKNTGDSDLENIEDDKMPLGKADLPEDKASLPRTGAVPTQLYLFAGLALIALGFKARKES
nr:hypothetical protein [uncultured Catonella sp.]